MQDGLVGGGALCGPEAFLGRPQSPLRARPSSDPASRKSRVQTQGTPKHRLLLRVGSDFSPVCFLCLPETGVRRSHRAPSSVPPPGPGAQQPSEPLPALTGRRRGRQTMP